MSVADIYAASPIKPRRRATRDEMEGRALFLIDYAQEHGPVTGRQLYYRAQVANVPGVLKVADESEREFIAGLVANIAKDRTP
jgi:hypothetical protein